MRPIRCRKCSDHCCRATGWTILTGTATWRWSSAIGKFFMAEVLRPQTNVAGFLKGSTWGDAMSWERDPLWAKARLYFERAFEVPRDDPRFGLWCSLALELLARAALASVSPTLLAEPDREHKFLLHALNRGSQKTPRRSIGTAQVFDLCKTLF